MPDTPSEATRQEAIEASVLERLTDPDNQRPWSVAEIARDFEDAIVVADAIATMHADGLIHRCGDLVFPSRAAVRAVALTGN